MLISNKEYMVTNSLSFSSQQGGRGWEKQFHIEIIHQSLRLSPVTAFHNEDFGVGQFFMSGIVGSTAGSLTSWVADTQYLYHSQ